MHARGELGGEATVMNMYSGVCGYVHVFHYMQVHRECEVEGGSSDRRGR